MQSSAPPDDQARLREGREAGSRIDGVPGENPARGVARGAYQEEARLVLDLLGSEERGLTLGQLRARTGLSAETLGRVLDGLRREGLVGRLNTLVESYVYRFPGVRVDHN